MTAGLGVGGHYYFKKPEPARLGASVVHPLRDNSVLLGIFANHMTDASHLDCMEAGLGQRIDLSLRFITLREVMKSPTGSFPHKEARLMGGRGGSIYLRLKITERDLKPSLFPRFSKALRIFAREAADFGGPVMLEPYFESSTSGAGPQTKSRLLSLIFESLSEARNVTWVWNPALGSPPAGLKPEWASINITQGYRNGKWTDFEQEFSGRLEALGPERSAILFVASAAPDSGRGEKNRFISDAMAAAVREGRIKGIVIFHAPIIEGSLAVSGPLTEMTMNDVRAQILSNRMLFATDPLGRPETRPLPQNNKARCPAVLNDFYTSHDASKKAEFEKVIAKLEQKLKESQGSELGAATRQALAQKYVELAALEKDPARTLALLERSEAMLKEALDRPDELKRRGKKADRYPIVFKYFDLKLQLAALYSTRGDHNQAQKIQEEALAQIGSEEVRVQEEALAQIGSEEVRVQQQVNAYSQKGYVNRAYLDLATVYAKLGKTEKAEEYFSRADKWATAEQGRNRISLFWRGEKRSKLRYVAAQAKLGLARSAFKLGKLPDAFHLMELLAWKEAGSEKGFMDITFGAFLNIMRAYYEEDPATARSRFNHSLPWARINGYRDLKKALDIDDVDLASPATDKWQVILDGMAAANLPGEELRTEYSMVRSYE
ncbi:MAG: hypothetical protein AMJ59_23655 [Gammaproteobacteria bacterium SG8_31]|nr:MAG: hypothetical protein AMJ59_23655 [Gammaproteobacteria bacterium SG8_31]